MVAGLNIDGLHGSRDGAGDLVVDSRFNAAVGADCAFKGLMRWPERRAPPAVSRVRDRTEIKTSTRMTAAPNQAQRQLNCFLSFAMQQNLSQYIGLEPWL